MEVALSGDNFPDIPYKSDKFGLGFTSKARKEVCRARAGGPPLRISNNEVNALEDTDSDGDLDDWIFPTTGGGFNNWKAKRLHLNLLQP